MTVGSTADGGARAALRRHFREKRRALRDDQQREAATQLLEQARQAHLLLPDSKVALYLANDGEINTQPMIDHCWAANIGVYLPILDPERAGHLMFQRFTAQTPMKANRFGIAEPVPAPEDTVSLGDFSVIFTPLVAFDDEGNRLGMGGGFYDRTLAPLKNNHQANCRLVGLAHDCQQAKSLPFQAWDIPLHGVLTPSRFLRPQTNKF